MTPKAIRTDASGHPECKRCVAVGLAVFRRGTFGFGRDRFRRSACSIRSIVEGLSVALLPDRFDPADHAIQNGLLHTIGHPIDPLEQLVQVDQIDLCQRQREGQIL